MAELQISRSPPIPSIWAGIFDPPDLRQWEWWPPNGLVQPDSVRVTSAPPPPPPPPPTQLSTPLKWWIDKFLKEEDENYFVDLEPQQPLMEKLLLDEVDFLEEELPNNWGTRFDDLCMVLNSQLSTGLISPLVTRTAFDRISRVLRQYRLPSRPTPVYDDMLFRLCTAIIYGAISCPVQGPSCFHYSLWAFILRGLASMPPRLEIVPPFVELMTHLPASCIHHVSHTALDLLIKILSMREFQIYDRIYPAQGHVQHWTRKTRRTIMWLKAAQCSYWYSGDAAHFGSNILDAAVRGYAYTNRLLSVFFHDRYTLASNIAATLQTAPLWQDPEFIFSATQYIKRHTWLDLPHDRHVRYQWMLVLAYLPRTSRDTLITATRCMCWLDEQQRHSLTPGEATRLLLSWWTAQGRLADPDTVWSRFESKPRIYGNLALFCRIIKETQPGSVHRALFKDLFCLLQELGLERLLIESFQRLVFWNPCPSDWSWIVLSVAEAIPEIAVRFRTMALVVARPNMIQLIWNKELHGRTMLDDVFLDTKKVLETLMVPAERCGKHKIKLPPRRKGLRRSEVLTAKYIVRAVSHFPLEMNRRAFRTATRVLRYLSMHKMPITNDIIQAMYDMATAGMSRGHLGKTERIKYVCGLAYRHAGDKEATALATGYHLAREANLQGLEARMQARKRYTV